MFKVVPLEAIHIKQMLEDPLNTNMKKIFTGSLIDDLVQSHSVAIINENKLYLVAGVKEYWRGRGHLWAMLSSSSKEVFVVVFRIIKRWLNEQMLERYFRLEVSIPYDFEQGKRRALMLGFKCEASYAPKYLPDQQDVAIYAMVRN